MIGFSIFDSIITPLSLWRINTLCYLYHIILFILFIHGFQANPSKKRPNVIIILADDLGYGDLGWAPFLGDEMKSVLTPHLQAMASQGMILTNFHTASPICSPSRASIMVGLFPWRLGIDFIYAGDLKKDGTEEMDHEQLPLLPNIAMSFHDYGYYTAHIGKWHLGGQTHIDIPKRAKLYNTSDYNYGCTTPGILQYGFDEYVGMSEGTGSMRYKTHQSGNTYSTGSKYLFRNDIPLPPPSPNSTEILTDRQTNEAMRVITEQVALGNPFFLNLWYDAPHSPWEAIEPYYKQYDNKFKTAMLQKYASMISNMDENIGRLLSLVDNLGIAEDTLIFFTSDNGPENSAGSAGPFIGLKRLVTEGGIRVPAIVQWKGKISPKSQSNKFLMTTDLYPTLLQVARIRIPSHIRIDGFSFLPILKGETKSIEGYGDERTVLWYTHSPGYPKFTAVWTHGYKLIWNDYEGRTGAKLPPAFRFYNMRTDPYERNNLLPTLCSDQSCNQFFYNQNSSYDIHFDTSVLSQTNTKQEIPNSAILLLVTHMQLIGHLFRYLGDYDWRITHSNPTHVYSNPRCHTRQSIVDTLTWHHSYLMPEFCGESVYIENKVYATQTCRCALTDCSNIIWYKPGVVHQNKILSYQVKISKDTIQYGIAQFAHPKNGLGQYIIWLLNITHFKPFCPIYELSNRLISSSNPDSIDSMLSYQARNRLEIIQSQSSVWALGSLMTDSIDRSNSDNRQVLGLSMGKKTSQPMKTSTGRLFRRSSRQLNEKILKELRDKRYDELNKGSMNQSIEQYRTRSLVQRKDLVNMNALSNHPSIHLDIELIKEIDSNPNNPVKRILHQRLHSRGNQVYITGTGNCGLDIAFLDLNLPYMSHPLLLCPESYYKYTNVNITDMKTVIKSGSTLNKAKVKDNYNNSHNYGIIMDDNLFLILLNLRIRRYRMDVMESEGKRLHMRLTHSTPDIFDYNSIYKMDPESDSFLSDFTIIDPLEFHIWYQANRYLTNTTVLDELGISEIINQNSPRLGLRSTNVLSNSLSTGQENQQIYNGFYRQVRSRLFQYANRSMIDRSVSSNRIIVLPMLLDHGIWGTTILFDPNYLSTRKNSHSNSQKISTIPFLVIIDPTHTMSKNKSKNKNRMDDGEESLLLHKWKSHLQHYLRINYSMMRTIPTYIFHSISKTQDSGLAVILFVREIIHVFQDRMKKGERSFTQEEISKVWIEVTKPFVLESERKHLLLLLQYLTRQSKEKEIKYYSYLSKNKFNVRS